MIHNVTLDYYGEKCASLVVQLVLLVIFFRIIIGISTAFFYWYLKRDNNNTDVYTNAYTNPETLIYQYKKMLYYNRINVSKGIDVNKSNK